MRAKKVYLALPDPESMEESESYMDGIYEWSEKNKSDIHKRSVDTMLEIYEKNITRPVVLYQFCEYFGEPAYADITVHREDYVDVISQALYYFESIEEYEMCAHIKTIEEKVNKIIKEKTNE